MSLCIRFKIRKVITQREQEKSRLVSELKET